MCRRCQCWISTWRPAPDSCYCICACLVASPIRAIESVHDNVAACPVRQITCRSGGACSAIAFIPCCRATFLGSLWHMLLSSPPALACPHLCLVSCSFVNVIDFMPELLTKVVADDVVRLAGCCLLGASSVGYLAERLAFCLIYYSITVRRKSSGRAWCSHQVHVWVYATKLLLLSSYTY